MKNRWRKFSIQLRAKCEIIENLIFLDIPITLTALSFFVLISISQIYFIPDYLGVSTINKNEFLSLVIGSVSSIMGIVISVILIRFELVRQRLGRQVNSYFLRNVWFKRLITLLTITICWALIVLLASNRFDSNSLLTHLYFVAILFFITIIIIFPTSYNILVSSTSIQIIRHELEKLDDKVIRNFKNNKDVYFRESYPLYDIDENTPIDILKRIAQTFIKENDTNAAKLLLFSSCEHLISWIGTSNDRIIINSDPNTPMFRHISGVSNDRDTIGTKIDTITSIWHVVVMESIAQKNIEILSSLWNTFFQLHIHFAKNKMYVLYLENLDSFEEKFFELLKQNNFSSVLSLGVKYRADVMKLHLMENCPEEKYLKRLDLLLGGKYVHEKNHNISENVEWEHISSFSAITSNISFGIDVNDMNLITQSFYTLNSLIHDISRLENISEKQKGYLLIMLYESCSIYFLQIIKSKNYVEHKYLPEIFNGNNIGEYVDSDVVYYKRIISIFSDFVVNIGLSNFDFITSNYINSLATLGRCCREKVSFDKRYLNTCYIVVDTFKYLKTKFEVDNIKYRKGYIKLKGQIESIRDYGKSHDKKADVEIIKYCNAILTTFKPEYLEEQTESKFVHWREN
jgi:hypothetical protein